jgi:transcriptional regulator with XRE-family HTH domain
VDVPSVVLQRLRELGLEQRDLAQAAGVTESYISQLVTRKKAPPAPSRTDIYDRMDKFLKLPRGELARLADLQRKHELKRTLGDEPVPLFHDVRDLILRKCDSERAAHVRAIFERQSFGELERLVTQKLLAVVKGVAKAEVGNDDWRRRVAQAGGHTDQALRVALPEFLDTDVFHLTAEHCRTFLDPLIESWDIDLPTFELEIVLNHTLAPGPPKRFAFVELEPEPAGAEEPGLKKFLADPSLSGTATEEEIDFLKRLRFTHQRPTPLYYYRVLQNLRDSLHFHTS